MGVRTHTANEYRIDKKNLRVLVYTNHNKNNNDSRELLHPRQHCEFVLYCSTSLQKGVRTDNQSRLIPN